MPPPKRPPLGLLLASLALLTAGCIGLFLLGLSWRSQAAALNRAQKAGPLLEYVRLRLRTLDALSRRPDADPAELRALAADAREKLEEAFQFDPAGEEPNLLLGEVSEWECRPDEARDAYEAALRASPESPLPRYRLGLLDVFRFFRRSLTDPAPPSEKEAAPAVTNLKRFVGRWPGWDLRYEATAAYLWLSGMPEEAEGQASSSIDHDDTRWRPRFLRALALAGLGKKEEALSAASETTTFAPAAADVHAIHGSLLEDLHRPAEAADAFEHAVRMDPFFTEAYVRLARLRAAAGRWREAWTLFDMALQVHPDFPPALEGLVAASLGMWEQGARPDDALLKRATEACEKLPFSHHVLWLRSRLVLASGDPESALRLMNEFPEREVDPEILQWKGEILAKLTRWKEAEADFTAALLLSKLPEQQSGILRSRARCRARQGNLPGAVEDHDARIALDPENPTALQDKAEMLLEADRTVESLAVVEAALRNHPRSARLRILQGRIRLRLRKPQDAIESASEALKNDPQSAQAYLLRGDAEHARGNVDAARRDWKTALSLDAALAPDVDERTNRLPR